jgi:hypothetical protein
MRKYLAVVLLVIVGALWLSAQHSAPKNPYVPQSTAEKKKLLDKLLSEIKDKPEWQRHIDWSVRDSGPPDCPWAYAADGQDATLCLAKGNRACLMGLAIADAKGGNQQHAYTRTLITQCHNAEAQGVIAAAGPQAVSDYLKANY